MVGGINWENGSIRPKASNTKQCKQLLDISHDHVLEQMVSKHTYITESSQSTLDLIFANNSTFINKVEVILGISDHEVVYVESSLRPDKTKKPSCLEPVAQLKPNFDGIVIGWSASKMVSGSCALPPRWPPQCSCVVIESSFDPGERLQAPGSLWFC